MLRASALTCFLFVVLCIPARALSQAPSETVLDGVYSEEQGTRGQLLYEATCGTCHGNALEGVSAPELVGDRFLERWRESALDLLHGFLMESMPPRRGRTAARIPESVYLDILAYVLKFNGYPAGESELTAERVSEVMLVGKDGPQPVPGGALVLTVGCLDQAPDGAWTLSYATEPVRTRTSTTTTPEELRTSSAMPLGNLVFRLADLPAVPDFMPEALSRGYKLQAKGYLIRQPNAERISLSSMETLDPFCE